MNTVIPVASGKGGVGKSVFVANLGITIASKGKAVVLVDLDLGGANLHTLLGMKNTLPGIGTLMHDRASRISNIVAETQVKRLFFIPGDNLVPGAANIDAGLKRKILTDLSKLPADYTILDLGAGSSFNTVDFFLASNTGLLVTEPEITAVLNAYSFLKTSVYRMLFRSFPAKSDERIKIAEYVASKKEGAGATFAELARELTAGGSAKAAGALERISSFSPMVVMNKGKAASDIHIGSKLREISVRNLGIDIEYVGYVPFDPKVPASVAKRAPLVLSEPGSAYARTISGIAERIMSRPSVPAPVLHDGDDDLYSLMKKAFANP